MKKLLKALADRQVESKELMNKEDVTVQELTEKGAEIDVINAKIRNQEVLDKGMKFDEDGDEIKDTKPVNQVLYAQPKKTDTPFDSLGEQLLSIAYSSRDGNATDERLMRIQNSTGANEDTPSEGGYLVQQDFATQLLKDVYATGILAAACSKVPIKAGANSITVNGFDETSRADGSRRGGVRGYWVEEGGTITASQPKFRQILLKPKKLATLYYATDELMSDAGALQSEMGVAFAEEMGFKLDDAIINGDGAGKPKGILSSSALISQAKEPGQAADTVVVENIFHMWSRMISSSRANAVWYINQEVEPQLYGMVLSSGTAGVPVYMPAGGISGAPYGTLFGRPVIPIEQCAKLGDVGDVILADMKRYKLADKGGIKMASSMHVQFLTDEMAFRTTYRVDGQTERASAITPYKATAGNTLSNFVTIAARA